MIEGRMTWAKTNVTVSQGETDVTARGLSAYHRVRA
jgi:hypothetical protein